MSSRYVFCLAFVYFLSDVLPWLSCVTSPLRSLTWRMFHKSSLFVHLAPLLLPKLHAFIHAHMSWWDTRWHIRGSHTPPHLCQPAVSPLESRSWWPAVRKFSETELPGTRDALLQFSYQVLPRHPIGSCIYLLWQAGGEAEVIWCAKFLFLLSALVRTHTHTHRLCNMSSGPKCNTTDYSII